MCPLYSSDSTVKTHEQKHQTHYGWDIRRTTPYQRANIAIMILIFIVTGTYAYFSYLQWTVLHNSMKLDQRAWIGIININAIFEIGKPFDITIEYKNTGKTPAKNVTAVGVAEPVNHNNSPNFMSEQNIKRNTRGILARYNLWQNTYFRSWHHRI